MAVLDEDYKALIGASRQTVYLSDWTLRKNKIRHPELSIDEYRKLPRATMAADAIIQDGDLTLVFIKLDNRFYHTAIKSTSTGKALFVSSFRRVDDVRRELKRLKRRKGARVIKDDFSKK